MLNQQHIIAVILIRALSAECSPLQQVPPTDTTKPSSPARFPGHEASWVSGSIRRGTLDILFPCILTLLLCAWTAVHSNIEPTFWNISYRRYLATRRLDECDPTEVSTIENIASQVRAPTPTITPKPLSSWDSFIAKLRHGLNTNKMAWSIITLLFPEISLLVAAHERRTAQMLTHAMQGAVALGKYTREWDLTLSYYALMGGFVVLEKLPAKGEMRMDEKGENDTSNTTTVDPNLETIRERVTLTPRGVLHVAQLGYLKYPPSQGVKDKSKVNRLAKFLVVVQAVWMIAQVLSRYITRLPVSLLELYTILHTMCAVVMYVVWIDKPVDITQPTFVDVPLDVMKMLSKKLVPNDQFSKYPGINKYENETEVFWHGEGTACLTSRAGLGKVLFRQLWNVSMIKREGIMGKILFVFEVYQAVLNGWKNFWREALGLSVVSVVHGCLHLVAWRYQFPSEVERRLWKISSLLTAGSVVIFCFSMLVGMLAQYFWNDLKGKEEISTHEIDSDTSATPDIEKMVLDTLKSDSKSLSDPQFSPGIKRPVRARQLSTSRIYTGAATRFIYGYCLCFLLGILPCVLARLYLLFESFVSMRRLPYGAYNKIMWTDFLPHVG